MNLLYDALVAHFDAQRRSALATLELYLTKPVSVHANVAVQEAVEQVSLLAESEDALRVLSSMVKPPEETPVPEEG